MRLYGLDIDRDFEAVTAGSMMTFVHNVTKLRFVKVPRGWFKFGVSSQDYAAANAIRPKSNLEAYHEILFPAEKIYQPSEMLVSITPILDYNLSLAGYDESQFAEPGYLGNVSIISFGLAMEFCTKYGFRLLTEREWEYCVRGGSETLFVWGDELLEDEDLELWMSSDVVDEHRVPPNGFGLKYLFCGEGCSDPFSPILPDTGPADNNFVLKGGAATLWPWQWDDWLFAIPGMRIPSARNEFQKFSFRVAINVLSE